MTRIADAIAADGRAHLVLTGGGIGTKVLAAIAASPARDAVDWRQVDVWWGDERFTRPGDPERNETGARAALLDHIDVDPARVHVIAGPGRAATATTRTRPPPGTPPSWPPPADAGRGAGARCRPSTC